MKLTTKALKETIDHAAALHAQIKKWEEELKANKAILKEWYEAQEKPEKVYRGATGQVTFVKEDTFAELDPVKVQDRIGDKFWDVITVGIGKLEEVIGKKEVAELRGPATGKILKQLLKVI